MKTGTKKKRNNARVEKGFRKTIHLTADGIFSRIVISARIEVNPDFQGITAEDAKKKQDELIAAVHGIAIEMGYSHLNIKFHDQRPA